MKKIPLLIILLFALLLTKAQDYLISFSGTGESTTVDSVFVENLTQGTSLKLAGSDTLHLLGSVGISSLSNTDKDLNIYPNPMQEASRIEFYNDQPDDVQIEVFDLEGKLIVSQSGQVYSGKNVFEISGFPAGFYAANITTHAWQNSVSFMSVNDADKAPSIKAGSTMMGSKSTVLLKNTKGHVQMQYNDGDNLLLKAIADDYARVLTIIPTQIQTINFDFVACTDLDSNNYAVVTIGNQTWMAENLKYLPSVVGIGTVSETTPYYYVYGYNGTDVSAAKATTNYDTYGVLYNWPAAMAGFSSSSSNPSGVQGVCPSGWHLPSDAEWTELSDYLGGQSVAGGKLKETGTIHWYSPNTGATNETSFTALPSGELFENGSFYNIGTNAAWWSTTRYNTDYIWYWGTGYDYSDLGRLFNSEKLGHAVRCIKN